MKNYANFNRNGALVTFIFSTLLSASVFSQGPPTTKFVDVNGKNQLKHNDTLLVGSHFKVENLAGGKDSSDMMVVVSKEGIFKKRPIPPERPRIGPPTPQAACFSLTARDYGSNNFSLCPEGGKNLGIGTTSNPAGPSTYPNGFRFAVLGNSKFFGGFVNIGSEDITTGTPHDDAILRVGGKIVSKKSIVSVLNWADDELKEDLTLEDDLVEEEKYKDKYGHLKGMKSGKTIEKDGINLGEMDVAQMRLIERLYLYLFKFNKVIQELKREKKLALNEVKELKKENKKLKKELRKKDEELEKRIVALEKKVE